MLESVISVVVRGGPLSGELLAVRCSSKGFSDPTISGFCYFCSRLSALLGGFPVPCSSMVRMWPFLALSKMAAPEKLFAQVVSSSSGDLHLNQLPPKVVIGDTVRGRIMQRL